MPENYNWDDDEPKFEWLVNALGNQNIGPADYQWDNEAELRDELFDIGRPDEWGEQLALVVDGSGDWSLFVGETEFYIGRQDEFEEIYSYLVDEWGIADVAAYIEYDESS